MTVLFVHSHRFLNHQNEIYSSGSFPEAIWKRYLKHFDQLIVLGRQDLSQSVNINKYSLSSHKNVSFELLDYLDSPLAIYQHKNRLKADIIKVINKHNIQAVIARLPSSISYKVIDVCEELGIPFAVEVVGSAYDAIYNYKLEPWCHPGNLGVKLIAPLSKRNQIKYVTKAKHAIYVTEHYLQKIYPTSLGATISHASNVELPEFDQTVLNQHVEILTQSKNKLKYGMIGNLDVHYKGYDIALKALAIAKDKIPDFELHFVGAGEGKAVKQLAKELNLDNHLVFNGKLPSGDSVFKYLDSLDVYLHPSRTEGLPRALIEAMGRGCPCLASTAGGIPELLNKQYLHNPGDYKTLSKQILELLNSKEKQQKAATTNFNKAKDYTVEVLTQRRNEFWQSFYESVKLSKNKNV